MEEITVKLLTTRQLARMWHVSEATIKRWADAGHLRASRTLGGHRRFSHEEVARFQNERGLARPPARQAQTGARQRGAGGGGLAASSSQVARKDVRRSFPKDFARGVAGRFFAAIAGGHDDAATSLLLELYLSGIPVAKILDETLAGGLRLVGERWHGGEMSVADEHLATRTSIRALDAFGRSIRPPRRAGEPLAFCCAAEDELHEVPVLCAQTLLESEGWNVKNFGANTPFFALAEIVKRDQPRLVCISSTVNLSLERSAREYVELHTAVRACGARLVLGGEGFRDKAVRRRFPADLYADKLQDLLSFIGE